MMIRVTKTTPDVYLCPVCNKRVQTVDYEYTGDDTTLNIYNCHECSLLFARPFVIPEITQRQMDSVEDAELFTPIYKKLHKTFVLKKEINEVRRIRGTRSLSLLDVGCGTGWTTNYWQTH